MMFPDHWCPVLQHNHMSVKDVSMLIVVCSKQSTETLTSNPEHDDKVTTLYFNQVIDCKYFLLLPISLKTDI